MNPSETLLVAVRASLRASRLRLRMSQADVAKRLGCSRKRVSEFELGLASPSFDFVLDYVNLVGGQFNYQEPDGDHLDFVSL